MRNGFLTLFVLAVLLSCKKVNPVTSEPLPPSPTHPEMIYNDLHSAEVKYGQFKNLDIDNDGSLDLLFDVMLLGRSDLTKGSLAILCVLKTGTKPVEQCAGSVPGTELDGSNFQNSSGIYLV